VEAGSRPRLTAAVLLGTLLNPLNSAMIAVALVRLQRDFDVSVATASWLISSFYLTSAVALPLMGRLADQFGPRRVFLSGLALVLATGLVVPAVPGFGGVVGLRTLQALGTATAYPAGLAMIRATAPAGRAPAATLGALNIAASVSAGLGPALAGFLVGVAGWQAIFLVNVPLTAVGLLLGLRWLPRIRLAPRAPGGLLRRIDVPGIVLFAGTLTALLVMLLESPHGLPWPLLPLPALGAALLAWWERRAPEPFLDVRMLARNPALVSVYLQFAGVNLVFYSIFFALPLWLQRVRAMQPYQAGLVLLPVAGLGVLVTPLAAALISRMGSRPALVLGAVGLVAGSLLLLTFGPATPVWAIVGAAMVFGLPNGLNNLGLQTALYDAAPAAAMGAVGGQFQTFRYVGAILSTSLLGLVFGSAISSEGLHLLAAVLVALSCVLLAVAGLARRRRPD
jgi:MFS family permease